MHVPTANTDSSVRGRILDALEQGRPYTKFDHIVAAAAVESLIVQEKRKAVEEAFRLLQEGSLSQAEILTTMFPPLLAHADEVIRRLSSPPTSPPPSAG
jgi:hypothetical protein